MIDVARVFVCLRACVIACLVVCVCLCVCLVWGLWLFVCCCVLRVGYLVCVSVCGLDCLPACVFVCFVFICFFVVRGCLFVSLFVVA